ncbi:superoxide dismutase [Pseudoxanthomonas kalamensis DSM 18571]|uniref:superoxide dismutase family protein n=1 Tax=Pseudoxanthomonas kalamensis TaxID=289483 RepID=UPI0013915822|nr:superoxide dismutase family protein [Pseudoxanthomonas kalamensis]KAF1712455.1 superoxide dismutase [Pseudoxanthomonas kalamensis DSM 18571]
MRRSLFLACIAGSAIGLSACGSAPPPKPALQVPDTSTAAEAVANLASASASLVSGRVTLVPEAGGVHITGVIGGLQPRAAHGFHVHEIGDCSAVDASSAGPHFNPFAAAHGHSTTPMDAHHAGDMDNLMADEEGVARVDVHLRGVTLGGGAVNDIAGRALIVHAQADDYRGQPAGNAGARVACGLIKVTKQAELSPAG